MSDPLPHAYELSCDWRAGVEGRVSAPPRPGLTTAPPPEVALEPVVEEAA